MKKQAKKQRVAPRRKPTRAENQARRARNAASLASQSLNLRRSVFTVEDTCEDFELLHALATGDDAEEAAEAHAEIAVWEQELREDGDPNGVLVALDELKARIEAHNQGSSR